MREDDIRPTALMDEFFVRLKRDAQRLVMRRDAFVRVSCPFCGMDDPEPAFIKDEFQYQSCHSCGSLYTSPRPSNADLVDYAVNSEAVKFWSTHFYKETADARREKIFRPRAIFVADFIAQQSRGLGHCETFADIGAGFGLFLQEFAALNTASQIIGIEPDAALAAVCRAKGFSVIEKWVEDLVEGEVAVDFATCFEVLEHVFDPYRFLRSCGHVLKPGGTLLFTTLTISGFDLQNLWDHARQISPPQHINFPSITGIESLIQRCGLEVIEISTPGQLDVDILMNYLVMQPDAPLPRFARALALADEATRRDFQTFLQTHRMSSHLRCIVRKP